MIHKTPHSKLNIEHNELNDKTPWWVSGSCSTSGSRCVILILRLTNQMTPHQDVPNIIWYWELLEIAMIKYYTAILEIFYSCSTDILQLF